MDRLLEPFRRAYDEPDAAIAAVGQSIVRTLGTDVPREIILAMGLAPVRLVAGSGRATPRADRLMGEATMGARGKRLLEAILDPAAPDLPLVITQADYEQPQIFAALRELRRLGEKVPSEIHFLDLLHLERPESAAYSRARLGQFVDWLKGLTGQRLDPAALDRTAATVRRQQDLLDQVATLRQQMRLSGSDGLRIIGSAAILSPAQHTEHLENLLAGADALPSLAGKRLYLAGSAHEQANLYEAIEAEGAVIVGESHAWGTPFHRQSIPSKLDGYAATAFRRPTRLASPDRVAAEAWADARRCETDALLHLSLKDDEAAPWDVAGFVAAKPQSIDFLAVRAPMDGHGKWRPRVTAFIGGSAANAPEPTTAATAPRPPGKPPEAGTRSRKSLESVADFGTYQRAWFAELRERVANGAPFAVVNANAPQEILRALDVPFVVNQWWASIVAAKQQSRRYLSLLSDRDYPTDVEAYSSQGLAAAFDSDAELAPWGGLPKPDFVHAVASSDPTSKIFEHWARETGAQCHIYERTVDPRDDITTRWWDDLPDHWNEALEAERLDLMVSELRSVVASIEATTDRCFDDTRFREIMDLVNEQEGYYRRTRDLIAATVPAPIGIVDSMPATMVPQWHRGTVWARDAAKAFYEEVEARAEAGLAAVPNERIRLMWVGRGLWSDMGFYQKWEESHGAVFVWSMYLALAADGYIRKLDPGDDPMRALAARFLTMGDELRMPTWAGPWHVHEAKTHSIDAAVALSDADPFVIRALREAGIPVLELSADNFSRKEDEAAAMEAAITAFIEGPASAASAARSECLHVSA